MDSTTLKLPALELQKVKYILSPMFVHGTLVIRPSATMHADRIHALERKVGESVTKSASVTQP